MFKYFKILFFILVAALFLGSVAFASTIDGTVTGVAWSKNIGWINFGASNGNIHVIDTVLTGQAWNKYFGWIKLNPTNGGVTNNSEGVLSGTAWGNNIGWVNFSGVTINSSGQFRGTATGTNIGDINFSCANCNVTTDWRPLSTRGGGPPPPPPPSPLPTCGDGACNGTETCSTCQVDCGACLPVCGNGVCNAGETCTSCSLDCGACPAVCGDNICNGTETCKTCETDCGQCEVLPFCGDGFCNNQETCLSCTADCGACPAVCGDNICNGSEDCRNCSLDCNSCPLFCGDGSCNNQETCSSCASDCGVCINPINPINPIKGGGGIEQKHNECNAQNQCISVSGFGFNICNTDTDCLTKNPIIEKINPVINEVSKTVEKQVENIKVTAQEVKRVVNTPTGSTITKTISTTGVVVTSAAGAASIWASAPSLIDLLSLPLRILGLLLTAFGIKKRILPWGTVYDSITKQPLDPVRVIIKSLPSKKEINSAITDLDGRYGFLVEKGTYFIEAGKTNYVFPSKNLAGKTEDEIYKDLYFGGEFKVVESGQAITKNIPLDPVDFNFNEFMKKNQKLNRFWSRWDTIIRIASDIFFVAGFFVAIIAYYAAPYLYNTVIMSLYVFLSVLILLGLKPKSLGYIVDKVTGDPIPFAIVRVFIPPYNIEFSHKVVDSRGRYYCLAPKGQYFVQIEKKNNDGSYSIVYTSPIKNGAKGGVVREKFKI